MLKNLLKYITVKKFNPLTLFTWARLTVALKVGYWSKQYEALAYEPKLWLFVHAQCLVYGTCKFSCVPLFISITVLNWTQLQMSTCYMSLNFYLKNKIACTRTWKPGISILLYNWLLNQVVFHALAFGLMT